MQVGGEGYPADFVFDQIMLADILLKWKQMLYTFPLDR